MVTGPVTRQRGGCRQHGDAVVTRRVGAPATDAFAPGRRETVWVVVNLGAERRQRGGGRAQPV